MTRRSYDRLFLCVRIVCLLMTVLAIAISIVDPIPSDRFRIPFLLTLNALLWWLQLDSRERRL